MGEFWVVFADMIRAGLNVDEPEGRPVLGRELLPTALDRNREIRPFAQLRGRHREPVPSVPTSLVPPVVADIDEKDRSSIPLRSLAWLQGVKR